MSFSVLSGCLASKPVSPLLRRPEKPESISLPKVTMKRKSHMLKKKVKTRSEIYVGEDGEA